MKKCFIFFLFVSLCSSGFTQAILVKDINKLPNDLTEDEFDYFINFVRAGNLIFFPIKESDGVELWRTDGTTQGTFPITDFKQGGFEGVQISSDFLYAAAIDDKILFSANDGGGYALWITDGTMEGTRKVKDVYTGEFFYFNDALYFKQYVSDESEGNVWRTDGTSEGTVKIPEFGYLKSSYNGTVSGNSQLFFFHYAFDWDFQGKKIELWRSNGVESGTQKVKDFALLSGSPSKAIVINDIAYFTLDNEEEGNKLWRSDGTLLGTYPIEDAGSYILEFNGRVLFSYNNEIKISDGGVGYAQVLLGNANIHSDQSVIINNVLFTKDYKSIIKTDGTPGGTQKIIDLGNVNDELVLLHDKIIFPINDWENEELGILNPETNAVALLKEIYPGSQGSHPYKLIPLSDKVIFLADDGIHGQEIWSTNGTEEGTQLVKDIKTGTRNSHPTIYGIVDDKLLFSAEERDVYPSSRSFWWTKGAGDETFKVENTNYSSVLGVLKNEFYYFDQYQLYKTSNVFESTLLLKDISQDVIEFRSSSPIRPIGDKFFFWVELVKNEDNLGFEPWITDGTPEGTHLVKDIYPGAESSSNSNGIAWNNKLWFAANDGVHGSELWMSDGTDSGTTLLKDIDEGSSGSNPIGFAALGDEMFFAASKTQTGNELWKTDGTETGTILLLDIVSGEGSSNPKLLTSAGALVYFVITDESNKPVLCRTDGSAEGTMRIKSFSKVSNLSTISDKLFFTADDGVNGAEVWTTDGTEQGTKMIEIASGMGSLNPGKIADVGGVGYFTSVDGVWKTKGTAETTKKLSDEISNIPPSNHYKEFTYFNSWVYYRAYTEAYGNELFKIKHKDFQTLSFSVPAVIEFTTEPIDLAVTIDSGLPLTLTSSDNSVAVIENGKVRILKTGTVTITAAQEGNDDWEPVSVSRNLEISKADQTIDFPQIANKVLGDAAYALTATASSGLPVTFSASSDRVAIVGNQLEFLKAGKVVVDGIQTGNENYNPQTVSSNEFCINPPKPTITENGFLLSSSNTHGNQWYKDNVLIEEATSSTLSITESGSYTVVTTVNECSSEPSLPVQFIVAGVENPLFVEVYPNPVELKTTVLLPVFAGSKEVKLMNAQGGIISESSTKGTQQEIDLSTQPSGIYLLRINGGGQSVLVKIIKK